MEYWLEPHYTKEVIYTYEDEKSILEEMTPCIKSFITIGALFTFILDAIKLIFESYIRNLMSGAPK
jgi:hypothetical protein